jgi:AAA+ ATPase superfamily predicted ATPase
MQAEPLIGREGERAVFDKAYDRRTGALLLVYGRRRIGKSFLLERLTEERPTVFYQATQQSTHEELAAFTRAVAPIVGGEYLPAGFVFPSWEAALDFIAERNRHPRLVVVLDEFPYLADTDPGLPSVIQRWWDKRGRASGIMLVLCGSAQTFMESLESSAAPLHGRFTTRMHIGPISFQAAAAFHASLPHDDHVRIYSILGGTPIYLRRWDAEQTIRDNIAALFGDPSSGLTDSVELALTTDLPDGRGSFRTLQSVGLGKTSYNDIMQAAKMHDRVIPRLIDLGLLVRRIPITDDPARSRRSVYAIGDPHFSFYFRFVAPNRGRIDRGFGSQVVDDIIMPRLDTHIGGVFEEMGREYSRTAIQRGELRGVDVGSWWSTDGQSEIDIVGVNAERHATFVGSVKWRDSELGGGVLRDLNASATALGADASVPRILVGRRGATASLTRTDGIRSVGLDELYR